jgi:hypothetical protein
MFVIIDLKIILHTQFVDIVTCPLKAKIVEPEEMAVAQQTHFCGNLHAGRSVSYAVHAMAIYCELNLIVCYF